MVAVILAAVMFPLWPHTLRIGVWYLSIAVLGLIGLFVILAIVRLIIWGITKLTLKPGIWIFPNLFEDVGIIESFIPYWAWDVLPPKKIKKKRALEGDVSGSGTSTPVKTKRSSRKNKNANEVVASAGARIQEIIDGKDE